MRALAIFTQVQKRVVASNSTESTSPIDSKKVVAAMTAPLTTGTFIISKRFVMVRSFRDQLSEEESRGGRKTDG